MNQTHLSKAWIDCGRLFQTGLTMKQKGDRLWHLKQIYYEDSTSLVIPKKVIKLAGIDSDCI